MFQDKDADGIITEKNDEVIQRYYYYPFGAETENTPWKQQTKPKIRYQYNGKEKIDELGLGWNDYGARNYDALLGRWMGVDALAEKMPGHNPYVYCLDSPVSLIDPDGKLPIWPLVYAFAVGFGIGAGADATVQIASNKVQGSPAFENYSVSSTFLSGAFGGVSGGTGGVTNTTLRTALTLGIAATESVSKQVITDEAVRSAYEGNFSGLKDNANNLSGTQVFSDVILDRIGGNIRAVGSNEIRVMERQLDRTTRIARNDPSSTGRATNQRNAQSRLSNANNANNYVGSTSGNGLQAISDGARNYFSMGNNQNTPISLPKTVAQDNTRTNIVLPLNKR